MKNILGKSKTSAQQDSQHWMGVSDLMAGLMMVFLFIAIALMQFEQKRVREVAMTYQNNQVAIYQALNNEFETDLKKWKAEIDPNTLVVKFNSPEVLFASGEIHLKPEFEDILSDFFPRYLDVLDEYKDSISEVKIEGHTSSDWNQDTTEHDAYFGNMYLSQGRTREVLRFVYNLDTITPHREWVRKNIAAVGYSSSRLIYKNGRNEGEPIEDYVRSRRVMFRVVTNAEIQIRKILEG